MINENIKKARKAKGISQEEMAVQLGVVRQTVSKWENSLSVPDADVLLRIAELLDVPAGQLLGLEEKDDEAQDLTEALARLNAQLAEKVRREKLQEQANKKRGLILFLSFASLLIALAVKNEIISILLTGGCILAALVILYRNLALLTSVTTEDIKTKTLRAVTVFDIAVIVVAFAVVLLDQAALAVMSEDGEKLFAMALTATVILFGGFISPRLPFSRHTGLRLPWTVLDEDTWNIAHRILGYISLPTVLLYIAASWTVDGFKLVSIAALLAWIGIPGGLPLAFYWKKMHGKL